MSVRSTHILKCWRPYFQDVLTGSKPFEVRKNDRDFKVGDTMTLLETMPGGSPFTGREVDVRITYVLAGGVFGIEPDCCVLGIAPKESK